MRAACVGATVDLSVAAPAAGDPPRGVCTLLPSRSQQGSAVQFSQRLEVCQVRRDCSVSLSLSLSVHTQFLPRECFSCWSLQGLLPAVVTLIAQVCCSDLFIKKCDFVLLAIDCDALSCLVLPCLNRDSDRANIWLKVFPSSSKRWVPVPVSLWHCTIIPPWSPFQHFCFQSGCLLSNVMQRNGQNHITI